MTSLFAAFVALVLAGAAYVLNRFLPAPYRRRALIGLAAWTAYVTYVGHAQLIARVDLVPPGLAFLMIPLVIFVAVLARSDAGAAVALRIPLALLVTLQSFRVVVELFLHGLWQEGRLPTMMTFHGANFDIVIGASAPIVGWLLARRKLSTGLALAWNAAGLALLANVAIRGALTAPGVLHILPSEVPNTAIGTLPFSYIPGVMVPLALCLHVLAIRALLHRRRCETGDAPRPAPAASDPRRIEGSPR